MKEKTEKRRSAVLRILRESTRPQSSSRIARHLKTLGFDWSERTVRLCLQQLDAEGLTETLGKRGRLITERGRQESQAEHAFERIGLLAAKIDQMTYRMSFDLEARRGTVVINANFLPLEMLPRAVPMIQKVFAAGYAMGRLVALFSPGQRIGETPVPDGCVGLGTVCSVTLNGALLRAGIPTNSRFGGLLELRDGKPSRFVELIHYEGTTLDPLEAFIRGGMTDYTHAVRSGNGQIGVSFREVPAESRSRVIELAGRLDQAGLGGFLEIGWPGQPLLDVPVSEGRVGVILIGGLNPIAILEENGMRPRYRALAGYVEYEDLFPYEELGQRVRRMTAGGGTEPR